MNREFQKKDQLGREKLDKEWVQLILLARASGMNIEEIRSFLDQCSTRNNRTESK
jgi:DNA-binding transcriptional MerR regulator